MKGEGWGYQESGDRVIAGDRVIGKENLRRRGEQPKRRAESKTLTTDQHGLSRILIGDQAHLARSVSSVFMRGEIFSYSLGSTMPVCFWYLPALSL